MPVTKLKYHGSDHGFCRMYFKPEDTEKKTLYAVQDDGYGGQRNFKLYVCSRDGEPSHEAKLENFEIPFVPAGDRFNDALNLQLRQWRDDFLTRKETANV